MAMPSNFERRGVNLVLAELRVMRRDDGEAVIEGYAAKYGTMSEDLGGFRETIHPEAFKSCIGRCDVRALKNHDPNLLLGRTKSGTLELTSDDVGLKFRCQMRATQTHRDTMSDIESGDMDGCSFSFTTDEPNGDDWDYSTNPPTRTLLRVRDLFDVGPVTYPAYLDTSVAARSLDAHRLAAMVRHPRALRSRLLKLRLGRNQP